MEAKQEDRRLPTSTKRGPGRKHVSGHKKSSAPKKHPAGFGFVQHTNPKRQQHRALIIAAHGVRQWKKLQRATRLMFPEAA